MKKLLLVAVLLTSATPTFAALITIDDFRTEQTYTLTAAAPASGGNVVNPAATAVGVERDLWLRKTAGTLGPAITAAINPFGQDLLRFDQGAGVRGSARVTWDGIDNDPDGIAYAGLNLDLGVASMGYFELLLTFNNIAGPIDFVVYDGTDTTGARRATGTINVPAGIDIDITTESPQSFFLNFADMTLLGGATDAMFRTVGAITMTINAEAVGQGGRDVNLDLVRANVVTIPAPAPLITIPFGLLALWLSRRQRARAAA